MKTIASKLPKDVRIGILHFGLGAFHRAHQAVFIEDAMAAAGDYRWGIASVGMRSPSLVEALNKQGGRYGLIERHPDGPVVREITSIRNALHLPSQPADVLHLMAQEDLAIVTVTVTEKGYCADLEKRRLDWSQPVLNHDIGHPSAPNSLVGTIVAGLAARRDTGQGGLTVISCDNLPSNGVLLRALVLEFARRTDVDLARWIDRTCSFPDTMVDRITPASTAETKALSEEAFGIADDVAVETEPFSQWVIEDNFVGDHPNLAAAGAQIVPDVGPFEAMKLRMLNGTHTAIALIGVLSGLTHVRDVVADPNFKAFLENHMRAVVPTLEGISPDEANRYGASLMNRFANSAIAHRCDQIATDTSQKLPQRIFEPAARAIANGGNFESFAFISAMWIAYLHAVATNETAKLSDPMIEDLLPMFLPGVGQHTVSRILDTVGLGLFDGGAKQKWIDAVSNQVERIVGSGKNVGIPEVSDL